MEEIWKLSHLLVTLFLYTFATMMIVPAITDVTMSALCPGQDECSLAIYLTGFQHAVSFNFRMRCYEADSFNYYCICFSKVYTKESKSSLFV